MQERTIACNRTVIDHLENDPKPFVSFEIIPPERGGRLSELEKVVSELASYNPPYIDVTSHPSEAIYKKTPAGIVRKDTRKRPGTLGICTLIQHKYKIDAVPHVLCNGFTREETEDFLIELSFAEIRNVLAIQGDSPAYQKEISKDRTVNRYASNLVEQIVSMNNGRYLDEELQEAERTNFHVGVACYPEKHFQAPNLTWDIRNLKRKLDAGASYAVTQMFFDNFKYYEFDRRCKEIGIGKPIIPGLKILDSKKQLTSLPARFHCTIPIELTDKVENAKAEEVENIGVEWAYSQIKDLFDKEVPSVHLYVMQKMSPVRKLMEKLRIEFS